MNKYTTIIMTLERKKRISNAKAAYMKENNLTTLGDAAYFEKLIQYYESKK